MSLQIREVTLVDRALLEAWHEVYERADRFDRPVGATPWRLPEVVAMLEQPGLTRSHRFLAGIVDGAVVAAAWLATPLLDNLETGFPMLYVDPTQRRQGYGSALLDHIERLYLAEGRSLLIIESHWPYTLGAAGDGWPGAAFAVARGYDLALGDVQRQLTLPMADGVLDRLGAQAAAYASGYDVEAFTGDVPDALVQGYAELDALVETEAPTGELELEPGVADAEAVRAQDAQLRAQDRTRVVTMALYAGEPVAYTELVVPGAEPGRAYQWGTLVRREHRGHRLGAALKVANLRLLQRTHPAVTEVLTWNAETNAHMIAVNDALGFVPVGRMGEFQKRLASA